MAVLPHWCGAGLGRAVLDALLRLAVRGGHRRVYLHAQRNAVGLYRSAGFTERGLPFTEAGIEHVKMEKMLDLGNTYQE